MKEGESLLSHAKDTLAVLAKGVAAHPERVDIAILEGGRPLEIVFATMNFYSMDLEAVLDGYGLVGVHVTQPFMHAGRGPEGSLREKYDELRFLTDLRPSHFVAYLLER